MSEPIITYGDIPGKWTLKENCIATSGGYEMLVPEGFITDLSSIPRALWFLAAPFELSTKGPLIHDWLYQHGGQIASRFSRRTGPFLPVHPAFTRKEADGFFYDLMKQDNVWWWRRALAYRMVRWFGGKAWVK